jgi:lysophospholipase L1-like esterase
MALPMGTEYHNFGISGERTAGAITDELPGALAVHPTVVTIWLNVNDLIAQVSVADYQTELQTLVHALRQGGAAKVLVANTPYLDRLPLYLACRGGAGAAGCSQVASLPGPDVVNSEVAAYNAAIASVTSTEGAILVDLHADGEVPDLHPQWVSADGFHPSTAGYVQVAGRFAAAYRG